MDGAPGVPPGIDGSSIGNDIGFANDTHIAEDAMNPSQPETARKPRVFITGSSDGLGLAAARNLMNEGFEVYLHVRSPERLPQVQSLIDQGAGATIGDLSDMDQTRDLARQVNTIGRMDVIIHNAGVSSGPALLPVNVVAPYLLTALIERPSRLIYISSSMHYDGKPTLDTLDWLGRRETASYPDTKLLVTALSLAVARLWPEVFVNAVDPGWVPTRMGGPNATGDLRKGHLTQEWLASSIDPQALSTGGYWFHQAQQPPHTAAQDEGFQNQLLQALERVTGTRLA